MSWSRKPSTLIGLSTGTRSTNTVSSISSDLTKPASQIGRKKRFEPPSREGKNVPPGMKTSLTVVVRGSTSRTSTRYG